MRDWYDWREATQTCTGCGWTGPGRDATMQEMFDGGAEFGCPVCGVEFGFVMYPTHDQMRTDPRADPVDRWAAGIREERFARFERMKLRTVDQLPDLDPPPATLTWDVATGPDGEGEVQILHRDRVIWRELSFYENYARFAQIAALLKRKYGAPLRDLVPTERSWLDLLGDRMSAEGDIDAAREAMR